MKVLGTKLRFQGINAIKMSPCTEILTAIILPVENKHLKLHKYSINIPKILIKIE